MDKKTVDDTGDMLVGKEVAVVAATSTGVSIGGKNYEIVKRVNVPTLKHEDGEVVTIIPNAPIRQEVNYTTKEVMVNGEKMNVQEENIINVLRVTEMSSGQPYEYVCNAMTADNIRSAYPDHSYVGKSFAIQKLGVAPGKRYKQTNVVEIAPQGDGIRSAS